VASFAAAGGVDVSLTVLAGDGGGLRANLDRWRQQLGLPPLTDGALEELPRRPMLGHDAVFVEMAGRYAAAGSVIDEAVLLGAVARHGASTVFVKAVGPVAAVAAQRESFAAFVASLRAGGSEAGVPAAPPPDMPAPPGGRLRWQVPAGWTLGDEAPMRAVTLHPGGDRAVHAYVVVLPGAAGGAAANLDRWREQLGLPPLDATARAALPRIRVLGADAPLLEASTAAQGVIGVVARIGRDSLFVKMVGPADAVRAARADFVTFCEALEVRP
jgi:hypothetical protein